MGFGPNRRKLWIYPLLIAGSVVFTIPFLWMVSTSFKQDDELFSNQIRLMPERPEPRAVSPYIDERVRGEVPADDAKAKELLDKLAQLATQKGFVAPAGVDRAAAERQVAGGLYTLLLRRLPRDIWDGPVSTILAAAEHDVQRQTVDEVFAASYRHLDLGGLRVRGNERTEQNLKSTGDIGWQLTGDASGSLVDHHESARPYTTVHYDLTRGERLLMSATFDLENDAAALQRVQLDVRPDDTWHELWLRIDRMGSSAAAREPFVLASDHWTTVTWQWPSPDDESMTKVKNWIVLDDTSQGHSELGPKQIRVTLELRRSSQLHAWAHKLRANYKRTWDFMPFWRYVRTSLFLVLANIVFAVFASSLVAYAFARLHWPGRDLCFVLMLATMMIPGQVTMVPHFLIWRFVGAYDTPTPLWLGAAFGNAFFIFLLRQFLKTIPRDLEEAARIDGCGFLRIYWHVMLPLIKPSLAAIAIFTFIGSWNDFLGPLLYLADQRLYPLAFGLYAFAVQVNNNPALTMAGSVLMTLPIIGIFFAMQKHFVEGITLTGMKG